ncbi:putative nuclease HARBI1 [Prorops nasuta]|uniref:putative nuclease HARBI1 n=1 Tax=Prorops nasuta TaxID=863751 RepID=UPI0034CD83D7
MDFALTHAIRLRLEDLENCNNGPRFHERIDAFDGLSEEKFIKLFRLNKKCTFRLCDIIEQNSSQQSRSSSLDTKVKVLTALRFLTSGSYQMCVGNNINMAISQSSVSRCIHEVINILNLPEIFSEWVHFPNNIEKLTELRNKFWVRHRFPEAIGCIDCTHVAIIAPPKSDELNPEHIYVNRKGYHSINVQLVIRKSISF